MVVGYDPTEGDGEERDMDRTQDNIGSGYRLCILGDLMIMAEEWWRFAKKGDYVWVTHILSTEVNIST